MIWPQNNGTVIRAMNMQLIGHLVNVLTTFKATSPRFPKKKANKITTFKTIWTEWIDYDLPLLLSNKKKKEKGGLSSLFINNSDSRLTMTRFRRNVAKCVQISLDEMRAIDYFK